MVLNTGDLLRIPGQRFQYIFDMTALYALDQPDSFPGIQLCQSVDRLIPAPAEILPDLLDGIDDEYMIIFVDPAVSC